ncbi:MAG: hypothetical protein BGO09_10245 [Bacteroidetes bacterium 47-18]|nr:MAG: hypothetical protein BGO09_10245 [Bacteroidetes bacterium 47-18]
MLRPDIKIQPTASDKILKSLITYLAVVILLINVLELYLNRNLEVAWMGKYKMILLSVFCILIALGGHYLTKHPQYFNYRKEINAVNAAYEYRRSIQAIRTALICMLLAITTLSFVHLFQRIQYLSDWQRFYLFPVIVALCLVFYIVIYFRSKKATPGAE